jgi:hypothetical protein
MFEHFTFAQRVNAGVAPDPDPNVSPKDVPTDWSASSVAPDKLIASAHTPTHAHSREGDNTSHRHRRHHAGAEPIDGLISQMSRQTLLPPLQHHFPNYNIDPTGQPALAHTVQSPCDLSTAPSYSPEVDVRCPRRLHHLQAADLAQPPQDSSDPPPAASGRKLPPWSDPRLHGQNHRAVREALMEIMITQGVQCNVHPSSPVTPVSVTQPLFPVLEARDPNEMHDDSVLEPQVLEVDSDCTNQDDTEALLRSYVKLRTVGSSGSMRKANGLRYCSSAEAALKSKNLKRNKIKMRKRDKTKVPPSLSPPEAPVATTSSV